MNATHIFQLILGASVISFVLSFDTFPDYGTCANNTFLPISGLSPALPSEACDANSPFVANSSSCMYSYFRHSFSLFYETFPKDVYFPRTIDLNNLDFKNAAPETSSDLFITATRDEMDKATTAIIWFMQCGLPFSVFCGGHSNAGASAVLGRRELFIRSLDLVESNLNESALYDDVWDGLEDIGTVSVGAGNTAGRAVYFVTDKGFEMAALPVGQKPSVGMSGLTLGGGFGFLTRYSGLLCDRLQSLTAIVPSTPEGKLVKVTKENEYADLFWASCGAGGGNFAVITEFEFKPVAICNPKDNPECNVLKLHLALPATAELVMYYQEWSMKMSTRITPNLEVYNSTHVIVAGIFLGDEDMWEEAVQLSGATTATPISSTDLKNSVTVSSFAKAVTSLTGWTDIHTPEALQYTFFEERSYFKYKSFWLFEPLPEEAIQILLDEAMLFESSKNYVVFEYQALGGDPGKQDNGEYQAISPKNIFSTIGPKDTAFPHRGAKHCLMFKSQVFDDEKLANAMLSHMEAIYSKIEPFVKGRASYYNHNDPNLPSETPYFQNGVELNPGITEDDKDFWLDKFREIRAKYNPLGMLVNPMGVGMAPNKDGETITSSGSFSKEPLGKASLLSMTVFVFIAPTYVLFF